MEQGGQKLFNVERQNEIIRILKGKNKITVQELSTYFNVSPTTIRTDMRELEKLHKLIRTHGGAILINERGEESVPEVKATEMVEQKKRIAIEALQRIKDGDRIIILTGTTAFELIRLLPQRKNLLVYLNDIRFASWLEKNSDCTVMLFGGRLRKPFHYTIPEGNDNVLNVFNVDKAFITCNGIDLNRGITTPDPETARFTKQVAKISGKTIVIADSSKLGKITFAQSLCLDEVNELITDDGGDPEYIKSIKKIIKVTEV